MDDQKDTDSLAADLERIVRGDETLSGRPAMAESFRRMIRYAQAQKFTPLEDPKKWVPLMYDEFIGAHHSLFEDRSPDEQRRWTAAVRYLINQLTVPEEIGPICTMAKKAIGRAGFLTGITRKPA